MVELRALRLTQQQKDCLRLVGENCSSEEIAQKLGITTNSVEARISAAMKLLDVTNRFDAVKLYKKKELFERHIGTTDDAHKEAAPDESSDHRSEDNRRNAPFDMELFVEALEDDERSATDRTSMFIRIILTSAEEFSDPGQSLEDDFNQRLNGRDTKEFERLVWDGSLGIVDKSSQQFIKSSLEKAEALWQNERKFILFIKDRLSDNDNSPHLPSVVERSERLASYARESGESGLEDYARLLFPEWSFAPKIIQAKPLPSEAPEIYQGLRGPETPPEFVQRVYGPWLGEGLDRAHVRHLDPGLYKAIDNWSRRNEWPADVDLPTRGEQNRRTVAQLREQAPQGKLGRVLGDFTAREAGRIRSAIQREREQGK